MSTEVQFPEKLRCLFTPSRYKFIRGGRGGGKSWSVARALLVKGSSKPLRVLCTREVQKSIRQSVHQLLRDQIVALSLEGFYEVTESEIRGKNGTLFIFAGLSDMTADSIKSLEGVDIVWIEEAHTITHRSLRILTPTIRRDGSEIWATFNPDLDTDPIYEMAVVSPPPDSISVEINHDENPWFPEVLEKERLHAQATMPEDEYAHVWEGRCRPAVSGAIYYNEVAGAEEEGRITNVPYDPLLKVHPVFDLGWNDAMAISLVQKGASDIRVIDYIEDSHKTLDHYSAELKNRDLNWGSLYLPHDGRTKDFKTGKSAEEIMSALGWDVKITPGMSVEDGIRLTRMTFPRMYFDKAKTERLVQCARRYRRTINRQTNEPGAPMHDEWSHGADCLRYIAVNAEAMTNEVWGGQINYKRLYAGR